jgi:hypothetical protein
MDYAEWKLAYKLIANPRSEIGGFLFTADQDIDYLRSVDVHNIWTEFDDGSEIYFENGFIESETDGTLSGYLVTEIPWVEGSEHRIFIGEYSGCGCLSDEDGEADEDCDQCYGDGYRLEWLTEDFPIITP